MGDADDPSDPAAPATRESRSSVFLNATVEQFGRGGSTSHRVRDLSAHGARIDRAAGMKSGATVLVSVGSLEAVGATIIWVKDGSAGLRFATPIDVQAAQARTAIPPPPKATTKGKPPFGAGWMNTIEDFYRKK